MYKNLYIINVLLNLLRKDTTSKTRIDNSKIPDLSCVFWNLVNIVRRLSQTKISTSKVEKGKISDSNHYQGSEIWNSKII